MIETLSHGAVHELRMNRPPANALTPELIGALRSSLRRAAEAGARAVVISSAVKLFSGGLDLPVLIGLERGEVGMLWLEFYGLVEDLARYPVPVVAAVNGHAIAGGAVIAMLCDRRVMAVEARIGLVEVQVGLPMPPVLYRALARQVGEPWATRMCVESLRLTAAEAHAIGLVEEVAAAGEVVGRAISWCEGLLKLPPVAMRETRALARTSLIELVEAARHERDDMVDLWFSEEAQRSMTAIVEGLKKKA